MNKLKQIPFKTGFLFLFIGTLGLMAQKETKRYSETFGVNDATVLELDTSHTDIEFETWTKKQVSIEAEISLEGATAEETEIYFKNDPITIMGNSKKITVRTPWGNNWLVGGPIVDMENVIVEVPEIESFHVEIPEIESLIVEIPEMPEIPPFPNVPFPNFDYEVYEREGEDYLKEWQENFRAHFDEDYKKRLEEWGNLFKERAKQRKERSEKRIKEREKAREERIKVMIASKEARRAAREVQINNRIHRNGDSLHVAPHVFYFNNQGTPRNYKVKKTIKIKMPKGTKLQMNVRHGEVKLAEHAQNINATLAHAQLWAGTIDGDGTHIRAQYSPVYVKRWKYGQLQAEYSDKVNLEEVLSLRLSATSSDIAIDRILESAFIKNDLGPLYINAVSKNFKNLDISVQNGELRCNLPDAPFTLSINGTNSKISAPDKLHLERTKNMNTEIIKGYHEDNRASQSVVIHSKFSTVELH
ncbi:MAG: DUF4097 family beta strand repeat-containing protein [Bacteroidota bacterium]